MGYDVTLATVVFVVNVVLVAVSLLSLSKVRVVVVVLHQGISAWMCLQHEDVPESGLW